MFDYMENTRSLYTRSLWLKFFCHPQLPTPSVLPHSFAYFSIGCCRLLVGLFINLERMGTLTLSLPGTLYTYYWYWYINWNVHCWLIVCKLSALHYATKHKDREPSYSFPLKVTMMWSNVVFKGMFIRQYRYWRSFRGGLLCLLYSYHLLLWETVISHQSFFPKALWKPECYIWAFYFIYLFKFIVDKARETKEKMHTWDYIKLGSFCAAKETTIKTEGIPLYGRP